MSKFIIFIAEWLGGPALIVQLRAEIDYLRGKILELEAERLKLQDSFLMKQGAVPINPEPLPEPTQQEVPFETWLKQDIKAEVDELAALAAADPETYGPMLEDAMDRYRDQLR